MPAIVTNDIRFNGSDNFISSVKNSNQMLYVFVGKNLPWDDDASTPEKNRSRFLEDSYDIEYMTRVYYSNLSRLMRYVEWSDIPDENGALITYDMYDDKQDISGANFITVSDNNVYKCLDNNNASESSKNPAGIREDGKDYSSDTSGVITTDDGYVWKYMYTIPDGGSVGTLNWRDPIETAVANWAPMDNVNTSEECPSQWDVRKNVVSGGIHAFRYSSNIPNDLLPINGIVTVTSSSGTGFIGKIDQNKRIICDPKHSTVSGVSPGSDYTKITSIEIKENDGAPALSFYNQTTPNTDYIYPIFSPTGGHGFDPARELNGFYILVTANMSGVDTDYRKVGLISNPLRKTRSDGSVNKLDHIKNDEIVLSEKIGKEFVIAESDYLRGTGEILYIEHKAENERQNINVDGIKTVKLILSF